jgi:hypothetical protein
MLEYAPAAAKLSDPDAVAKRTDCRSARSVRLSREAGCDASDAEVEILTWYTELIAVSLSTQ